MATSGREMAMANPVADAAQRSRALEVAGSFIVQAPAGSGKTELLIQRILALLATVSVPEEILAITFTRKAAAEMHKRLLEALENAARGAAPAEAHARQTWTLARAALERDRACGWNLTDCPARLQVLTIDSFCAALVRRMPWLARFGEAPVIADESLDLYRAAAERLLARLEQGGDGGAAIERLLDHLDNRWPLLRDLLVAMLGRRDQWLRHLDPSFLAAARPDLESALRLHVVTALESLHSVLPGDLLYELTLLGSWAAGNLAADGDDNPLAALQGRCTPPCATVDELPVWLALTHLVLTGDDGIRKTVNRSLGFPADKDRVAVDMKARILAVCDRLRDQAVVIQYFRELRRLPATAYGEAQWQVLAALIELLPLAERELRSVFRDEGQVDFVEVSRGALAALGDDLAPGDLLLHLDGRLRHILVDEFQDTSRGQFELLSRLTAGWEDGDGRTLFVVGDPMQSIYRFREADVGLYLQVRARGLETRRLEPLALQVNFRSQAGLVDWFNTTFAALFPGEEDVVRGAVPYAPATATRPPESGPAVTLACFAGRDDAAEARLIIALVRQAQDATPDGTTAVLVRSRSHLSALVAALKAAGIPWQAQEIDPLGSRPAIRDLVSLTRALLHPADRVAWLAVLRAPWCGLGLNDLLMLCGGDATATVWERLAGSDRQPQLFPGVSADGQARLQPVTGVLGRALAARGRVPLRRLVESAWLGLNGPAGLAAGDLDDADRFFALLESLDEGGDLVSLETLEERLGRLFAAPDPQAGSRLQLMTIHKAKGLEFDTVILPGLGRTVRAPERPLLLWQEQVSPRPGRAGLLLAPLPSSAADERDPTYRAIAGIHADKDRLETLRLFYVAATRARRQLHLIGHARPAPGGSLAPAAGSFLHAAWPALAGEAQGACRSAGEGGPARAPRRLVLRRLPVDWRPPAFATALSLVTSAPRRASDAGHLQSSGLALSLRSEEGRIIGILVHELFERIACDGLDAWPPERLPGERSTLCDALSNGGVPRSRLDACLERVLQAVRMTLASPRGRWILAAHRDAFCELELKGVDDGAVRPAVIDRTFVDDDDVCWVIDYKTSSPDGGETVDGFLAREKERYRGQLDVYRKFMALREPLRNVRAALYFPLVDAWCEFD
ncbi:MAG: DNA helicase UvrD [Deltaproteobacteria bacterium]|nr:MAG: DNA helicase UvrD [Deltaproteobacteria bacterium]